MIQMHALYVFLAVGGLLAAIFIYVGLSTRHARDVDYHSAYRLRKILFFVVIAVLLGALGATLGKTPYPRASELPDKVVFVVGKQFAWGISDQPIKNDDDYNAATYGETVDVPRGSLVEFRVTSFDVNHDFSVYSPDGVLVGQTQAMPGYVNRLRLRFSKPGQYTVLCLELCGMDHHRMRGTFDVK